MSAPTLTFIVEPIVAGAAVFQPQAVVFQPSAPVQAGSKPTGRLLLSFFMTNTGPDPLTMETVKVSFPGSNVPSALVPIISDGKHVTLKAGESTGWGFANTDDIILAIPAPPKVTIEIIVKGNPIWVSKTLPLRPFTDAIMSPPFRSADLRDGEYIVTGRCSHGAGGFGADQGFNYDVGVQNFAVSGGGEREFLPGTDSSKNTNFRIFGLPVYAMAGGVIVEVRRDVPTNPDPPLYDTNYFKTGVTDGGGGNYVAIDHGNGYVTGYCHMQSIYMPPSLIKGAHVTAGQLLGRVGNSGNSSEPHIHFGGMSWPKETLRPVVFGRGWVLGCDAGALNPVSPWVQVDNQGLPALAGDAESGAAVAWWPDGTRPVRFAPGRTEVFLGGVPEASYQATFDELAADGYDVHAIRTVNVAGKIWFSVVARPAAGDLVAFHGRTQEDFQSLFDELTKKKDYRLTCLHGYGTTHIRLAGVFRKVRGLVGSVPWSASALVTAAHHQADLANAKQNGMFPTSLSVVVDAAGNDLFSAIYEKGDVGEWKTASIPLATYQEGFDHENQQGRSLAALDAHQHPLLGDMLDVIFQAKNAGGAAHHDLSLNDMAEQCHQRRLNGQLTHAMASYQDKGVMRFAGLWR